MTKVNLNNENDTKSDILPWDMFKSSIIFFYQKILKYFNDFENQNFSVLWLNWTQVIQMKQRQTFSYGTYSNLTSFFIGCKILYYFNDFYNWHLSFSLQIWAKISKMK